MAIAMILHQKTILEAISPMLMGPGSGVLDAGAVLSIAALWFGAIADGVLLSRLARRHQCSLWGAGTMSLCTGGSLRLDAAENQGKRKAP